MNWLEITVESKPEELEDLCAALEAAGVEGLVIQDEATVNDFLDKNKKYWDYVDDAVMERVKGICSVSFYLEDSEDGKIEMERIQAAVPGRYMINTIKNEDWENNWKEYYQPIETGQRLIIVPEWLDVPESGRVPLKMDPGLIFGTGSHPTTRMCLEEMERFSPRKVLDLGCGSGILGIAALLLGAEHATGCDIDDKAPRVVKENGALNGLMEDRLTVYDGDVLHDTALSDKLNGKYDLVLANIVADVIIALAPSVPQWLAPGAAFICSGIIEGRQYEVERALHNAGMAITNHKKSEEWHCYTAEIREKEK